MIHEGQTSPNGELGFKNLFPGKCKLSFSGHQLTLLSGEVEVKRRKNLVLEVVMKREPIVP